MTIEKDKETVEGEASVSVPVPVPLAVSNEKTEAVEDKKIQARKKNAPTFTKKSFFKAYLNEEETSAGLADGTLTEGSIRVNQRNYEQCFIGHPEGEEFGDLLILGGEDRNRAFNGDRVVVRIKPKASWFLHENHCQRYEVRLLPRPEPEIKEDCGERVYRLQNFRRVKELADCSHVPDALFKKTAEVVAIAEKCASRKIVGHLKPMPNNDKFALFSPTDSRIPRLLIHSNKAPTGFFQRPQDFIKYIYLAELTEWREDSKFPIGQLLDQLGLAGDIEAEHKGLLLVNSIDLREYDDHPEVTESLPLPKQPGEWKIDEAELKRRDDFRNDVVFTIDPLTARDLDDALHIKRITREETGTECWEVGVHIADVSYFLQKGTPLDEWACKRGTSVYLVHQVIPMLPRILCEELCSLNPGVDRLTFSVIWLMDDEANILHTRFCRSVIRSCAKLAYEHAQDILDNPGKQFAKSEMPTIHCGRKIRHIKEGVRNLQFIAKKLKKKRFGDGALKLDLPKLRFDVEKSDNGIWQPRGIRLDERRGANFLVEEFMLLANMAVARHIYRHFKHTALLRRHPPPKMKELGNLIERCAKLGIRINPMNSKTLAESLSKFDQTEEHKYAVLPALNQMLMKCMHLARYFCTGTVDSPSEFRHYALSVDFYTHFTSPIRRYPDVIVHRLLAECLGLGSGAGYSVKEVAKIAELANARKTSAKICSDLSGEIFFGAMVRGSEGHFEALAVVMAVFDGCFDVLLLKYAIIKRVYLKRQQQVSQIYYGRVESGGQTKLVLMLTSGEGKTQNGAGTSNEEQEKAAAELCLEDEFDENQADRDVETEAPPWVSECPAQQRQTVEMLSIVRVRLVPVKNSVKYDVKLVSTPDSRQLTWVDISRDT